MSATPLNLRLLTEAALVLAAQSGEQAAFTELVRRREAWLRTLMGRMCADAAEGDDLAQEAFLRAWQRLDRLAEPAAFGAWLRRIAVRLFIDVRRIKRVELTDVTDMLIDKTSGPEDVAGAAIDLERTLEALSPEERFCVVLKLGEGLSHAEILEISGMPLGTIKSHVHRGLAKARKFLGEEHE